MPEGGQTVSHALAIPDLAQHGLKRKLQSPRALDPNTTILALFVFYTASPARRAPGFYQPAFGVVVVLIACWPRDSDRPFALLTIGVSLQVLLSCGRHVHIRSSCRTLGYIRRLQLSFKGAILAVLTFVFGLAISCGRNVLYCPLTRLQLRAGTQLQLTSIPAKRTFVD
ncbi:hypothetical protein B0H13DRAFT_1915355 [Mycena leptocephala]|nr:hypothetical protein B0H13DRAFT_1915355 [Mycena leptocephala]